MGSKIEWTKDAQGNWVKSETATPQQDRKTVARVKSRRQQPQQQNNSGVDEINALYRGMQGMPSPQGFKKPIVRRTMSGNIEGQGTLEGLDKFYGQNPHLKGAADRQAQYDAQGKRDMLGNAQSAIQERKALRGIQSANPNLVKGNDGYMSLFDGKGGVIGTTKPVRSNEPWSQDNAINRGTATRGEQAGFRDAMANTARSSAGSELFVPPAPKSSSPGVTPNAALAGRDGSAGAPGGDLFQGYKNPSLPSSPTSRGDPDVPQGPQLFRNNMESMQNDARNVSPFEHRAPYMPPELAQFNGPTPLSFDQTAALSKLKGYGGNMNARISDIWPGVNDYDYLQLLFPWINPADYQGTNSLLDAYRNIAR